MNNLILNYKIGGIRLVLAKLIGKIKKSDRAFLLAQECMLKKSLPELAEFHKWYYEKETGRKLDYEHPQNICEKVQQLLIYDAQPYKAKWADKYEAKRMAAEILGEEHVAKLLGVWKTFEEIDFDSLPDSFVLKATHGSGFNLIVKNKSRLDMKFVRTVVHKWLITNYGATFKCELQYRKIEPRLIAEEYLSPSEGVLMDYKFECVNGVPQRLIITDITSDIGFLFYMMDGNLVHIPFEDESTKNQPINIPEGDTRFEKPENFDEILDIVKKLSRGMDFVRVDLYLCGSKIYFGEMTFTPAAFMSSTWAHPELWFFLDEESRAWAKTGLPEHITEL